MRVRRSVGLIAVAVMLVAGLTACGAPADRAEKSVSGVVDETGIELSLDGVTVSAGPDVAPAGTKLTVTSDSRTLDDLGPHATELASGVSVTLGDDLQPASPISITFRVDDVSEGVEVDGTLVPNIYAVASQTSAGEWAPPTIAEADTTAGTVTTLVTHLSWFSPISIAIGEAWKAVKQSMGIESPRPECASDKPELNGVSLAAQPWNAWVCLVPDGKGVAVEMTSNANLPFVFLSTPAAEVASNPGLGLSAMLTQELFNAGYQGEGDLLQQGGSVRLSFGGATPDSISMWQDEASLVLRILLDFAGVFVPDKAAQVLFLDELGKLQCASDLLATATSGAMNAESISAFTAAFFSCASVAIDANSGAAVLLWAVGAAPGSLVALAQGALNEFTKIDKSEVVFLSQAAARPPMSCDQMNAVAFERGSRVADELGANPPQPVGAEVFEYFAGPLAIAIMRKAVSVQGCAYSTSLETGVSQWNARLTPADRTALVDGLRASPDYAESAKGDAVVFVGELAQDDDGGLFGAYTQYLTYAFVGNTWIAIEGMEPTLPLLDSALAGAR